MRTRAAGLVQIAERSFASLRVWAALERLLERADLPLRAGELFYLCAGAAFLVGLLAAAFGLPAVLILLVFLLGALTPVGFVKLKARKRLKAFDAQLAELLLTIGASLKAGHSFKQALQGVVEEAEPPASKEFNRVLAEMQLGRPMDDALRAMAKRVGSRNLEFVITAVTIQRQVGGSLAGLFDMVAETVRQREQFARKVKGLTAMGRGSAYVLIGLPFVLAGLLTVINADYMRPLWTTPTGRMMLAIGAVSMTIGAVILRKMVSFKV